MLNFSLALLLAAQPAQPSVDSKVIVVTGRRLADTEAALRACLGSAGGYCSTSLLPCGDSKFGSLTGTSAVSIPAGQSRIIAVTIELAHQAGNTVEGPIALHVRTDSFE